MKKLHSLAFYALVTPIMTLGAGSLMAEQSQDLDTKHDQKSTQSDRDNMQSDHKNMQQVRTEHRGFMEVVPENGMHVSDLLGTDVNTTSNEDVGSVDELIIDDKGQVIAIVVGVGGFLGMGEKNVAIGWDEVTVSGSSDDGILLGDNLELQIDMSRDVLRDAPGFEMDD